jgi:hypothetical protein
MIVWLVNISGQGTVTAAFFIARCKRNVDGQMTIGNNIDLLPQEGSTISINYSFWFLQVGRGRNYTMTMIRKLP